MVARFCCSLFSTRERTGCPCGTYPRAAKRIGHCRERHIEDHRGFGAPVRVIIGIIARWRVPDMFLLYRRCETSRSNTRKSKNHPAEHRQLNQNIFHHHSVIVNGTA
ncbi:hypothetical protein KIF59_10620 [Enterobacter cloacae subsp. cloacae]|nr:hypothetical protein [Enterobacter cloacae subsp. cloacae]